MIQGILRLLGYEKRALSEAALAGGFFGVSDGIQVNETTALNFSAVYRAVSLISGTVSTLPLHVYQRTSNTERQTVTDHPMAILLESPNEEMDGATFRETLQAHALTYGNGYAEIERGGGSQALALHPLPPDRVSPERVNGKLVYKVRQSTERTLAPENVFHLRGLGFDGLKGYSPIKMAERSIALGMEAECFGERFFSAGTHLGGVIERPVGVAWTDEAAKRFKSDFSDYHQGVGKSHKVAVLEDGMKFNKLGMPLEEAQFLQTRKFQVTEIARWFGVPPHLLYDLERSTNNNIEHQGIEFLTGLRYWLSKWEVAIKRSLISDTDLYVEHVTQDLVRTDLAGRYAAYNVGRSGGWLSINDIRRAENLPPVPGGDSYLQPLNMQPVGAEPAADEPADEPDDEAERSLLAVTLDRLNRNEANAMRRAAKKPDVPQAVDEFYRDYEPVLRETLEPILKLRSFNIDADTFIRQHIADHRAAVLASSNIEATVSGWHKEV